MGPSGCFCFTWSPSCGFGKAISPDRSWCLQGWVMLLSTDIHTHIVECVHRQCMLFNIHMSISLCMCRPWIYACGCVCDCSTVDPKANQSQNAMLPGVPLSMMTQEEENVVRWCVEIRAEMRALTRDSGKEASGQNADFWCGNVWVKSDHVWRLWLDMRTMQERGTVPLKGLISQT